MGGPSTQQLLTDLHWCQTFQSPDVSCKHVSLVYEVAIGLQIVYSGQFKGSLNCI